MSDTWKKIKDVVAGIAPILGNAIVPGAGGVAGAILAKALGCDVNKPQEILDKVLSLTPEQAGMLQAVTDRHEERLIELGMKNDESYILDVQNARQREIELTKAAGGKKEINLYVLAWVIMGGFFGTIIAIILLKILAPAVDLNNEPLLSLLLGSLSTDAGMVVGYFFGSSKSSQDKNIMIAAQRQLEGPPK